MRVSQNFHCIFLLIFAYFSSISEFTITCMSPKVVRVMLVTVRIVKKTIFTEQTLKNKEKNLSKTQNRVTKFLTPLFGNVSADKWHSRMHRYF